MKFRKSMFMLVLVIFLFSIAAVSANEVDDSSLASEDNFEIDHPTDDVIGEDIKLDSSGFIYQPYFFLV